MNLNIGCIEISFRHTHATILMQMNLNIGCIEIAIWHI